MDCTPEIGGHSGCTANPDDYLSSFAAKFDQSCTKNGTNQGQEWDKHRSHAEKIEQLYQRSGLSNYSRRVHDCSRWLGFALKTQDTGELKLKLTEARFCRVRYCPVCQWRKSMAWRARFLAALPKVTAAYPYHRWVFLTLTVRNCPVDELRVTLKTMGAAWSRLTQRSAFPATGWIRSTEVTKADSEAHPHFHCLLLVPSSYYTRSYLSQRSWTDLWQSCLRVDYTPIVHVKSVKPRAGFDQETQLTKAVLETLKYSVKPQDLVADSEWLYKLTQQLHKTRSINVGGVLKDFIREDEPTDLIHCEEIEESILDKEVELWFNWREMIKRYTKVNK